MQSNPWESLLTRLEIAASRDRFVRHGSDVFLLGDTAWAAFSRATLEEWTAYLAMRKGQGFNSVYISVLPIAHDRSVSADDRTPFRMYQDGGWDLSAIDLDYFEQAAHMVELAVAAGFTPFLVLLWCNYVPDSWGSRLTPELVLDERQNRSYLDHVVATFAHLDPVFVISGDDALTGEAAVQRYVDSLEHVKAAAPGCHTTMHTTPAAIEDMRRLTRLPRQIADAESLGFYSFQSGHDGDYIRRTWDLTEHYLDLPIRRPIINMEPCYEGIGHFATGARHGAKAVRHASWSSILSGAAAGLGYGAHGVWSWHRRGDRYTNESKFGPPFSVDEAIRFRGSQDVGLLRWIVESHNLFGLRPRHDLLVTDPPGVRVGATENLATIGVYAPFAYPIAIGADCMGYKLTSWDLVSRERYEASVTHHRDSLEIGLPGFNGDALHVVETTPQ